MFATHLEQRSPFCFLCAAISNNAVDRYDYLKREIDVIFLLFLFVCVKFPLFLFFVCFSMWATNTILE